MAISWNADTIWPLYGRRPRGTRMKFSENNPLGKLFFDAVARYGAREAIRTPEVSISYSEMQSIVTSLARNLQTQGVARGALVGVSFRKNPVQSTLSIMALTLLGAQWVRFGSHLIGHKTIELTHLLHNDPSRPEQAGAILASKVWPSATDSHTGDEAYDFDGYASAEDPWFLAASSGTTGKVKSMAISGRMFFERILRLTENSEISGTFSAADLYPRSANLACFYFFYTLHIGGTYLLSRKYDYLRSESVRLVVGSPAQLEDFLADIPPPASPELFEVRAGGSSVSPGFVSKLQQYFQTVRVNYGSTEVGPVSSKLAQDEAYDRSVGRCYPDVSLEIVDENGGRLDPGTEGTVRIKASSQVKGYLGDAEASEQAFREGWFYPGDKGYLSPAGELYITGREQDHLNIGGLKFNATSIDEIMQSTDKVADAICFLDVNSTGVAKLAALVAFEPDADKKQTVKALVHALLSGKIDFAQLPKNIYQVSEIPRNANGKAMRHEAAPLAAGLKPFAQIGS